MSRYCMTATKLLALASIILFTHSIKAEQLSRARLIADSCAMCHGNACSGSLSIPAINGTMQPQEFMYKMNGFYFGDENTTVMGRIAQGLSREEMSELSFYFSQAK